MNCRVSRFIGCGCGSRSVAFRANLDGNGVRGLYHFNYAYNQDKATDPIAYLAAPENRGLGVIKTVRKLPQKLDMREFPSLS